MLHMVDQFAAARRKLAIAPPYSQLYLPVAESQVPCVQIMSKSLCCLPEQVALGNKRLFAKRLMKTSVGEVMRDEPFWGQ